MAKEHVKAPQDLKGGEGLPDDASENLEALQAQIEELHKGMVKRDEALAKMQSDRDKVAKSLEREQQRRERAEASRMKDIGKLPDTQQTEYLKSVATQEHQRATRFELAHQYGLDPTDLEGNYPSPEAMKLHALELAQKRDSGDLESKVTQLTSMVTQLVELQQEQQDQPPPAAGPVLVDVGGRRAAQLPTTDVLQEFAELAEQYRKDGKHKLSVEAMLAKIHRDPSKVLGTSSPTEELPPELQAKLRR